MNKIILFCFVLMLGMRAALALTPESSGYIAVDHGKVYYERYGSGPPILVLHGGPGLDQGYLKPQLLALAKDHEVIFYDQRGSGKSLETVMDRKYINFEQFTRDVEAVRIGLGLENIIVFGHSWGGLLGLNYTIKYPDHVAKLILADSAPADFKGLMAASSEINKRVAPFREEVAALDHYEELAKLTAEQISALQRKVFSVYVKDPNDAEKLTLNMSVESVLGGFRVMELLQKDMFINLIPKLKNLNVPTLIVLGDHDVVPLWTMEAIQKALPNAKMVVIPECGHFPYVERSEEFFKALELS